MIKCGLTGGIGSGKSVVANIFEVLGIAVYNSDDAAKRLMNHDAGLRKEIIRHFGKEAYTGEELNRSYISKIVFENKQKLELLNSLVHPVTIRDGERWMKEQKGAYAIKEAALIFESGTNGLLDYVIGVRASEALRIERVMKRDHVTRQQVLNRMKTQMDDDRKISLCDFVIHNDEQHAVLPQVLRLHESLSRLAGK